MTTVNVDAGEVMRSVTIDLRVVGMDLAKLRLWLACKIIAFAALVGGCDFQVSIAEEFDSLPPPGGTRSYRKLGDLVVPEQLSVRESSPLYVSNFVDTGSKIDVLLDGVRQTQVISYDAIGGYVRVNKLDADGNLVIAGGEIVTEVRSGNVELVLKQ